MVVLTPKLEVAIPVHTKFFVTKYFKKVITKEKLSDGRK